MKLAPLLAIGGTLTLGALALRSASASSRPRSRRVSTSPEQITALASTAAEVVAQPGLPAYLLAVAWTETGGTWSTSARGRAGELGIFQMRPSTARLDELGLPPAALLDLRWSVALAAWLIARLRHRGAPGQVIDWLAIRRGWAYPHLVADVDEVLPATDGAEPGKRSREVRERFENALSHTGQDPSFMFTPAFPPGYRWPGLGPVTSALGLEGAP